MWQGIEEFFHVVEQGSFTLAAKHMDVSTSHISRQISQLEQRLGTELIKRTTRTIHLTDAGRQYVTKLKAIRQELLDANALLQGDQQSPIGHIRITGAGEFVARTVAPLLAEFIKRYPQVSIEMDFSNRNVNLIEEGFDLATRFGRMQDSNLIARPLTQRAMTLVASPEYLASYDAPTHPKQLKDHNCLIAIGNRWRFKIDNKIEEVKVQGNWRSNHGDALMHACLAGLGIAHLAQDLVADYLQSGKLCSLLNEYQVTDNATWLVYPRKDLMPHRIRLLIEFLTEHFSQVR